MTIFTAASVGDLANLISDFERLLRAANKSPRTVGTYRDAARRLKSFLAERGMPTEVNIEQQARRSPAPRTSVTARSPSSLSSSSSIKLINSMVLM